MTSNGATKRKALPKWGEVRIFSDLEACLTLITALCVEQSKEWATGKRRLEVGELKERCSRTRDEFSLKR